VRDGFRVLDSDIHVIEPRDLWARYLDPAFRDRAPTAPTERSAAWMVVGDRPVPAGPTPLPASGPWPCATGRPR
jgi:hypothetical protein